MLPAVELTKKFMAAYKAAQKKVCKAWNVPEVSLDILLFLANNPGMDTARDICTYRHLKPAIVSFHVDNLVREGYLERREGPGDRRKCRLVCTEKASDVIARGREAQEAFSRQLTEGLTEEELELCFRCFAVFGENMARLTGRRSPCKEK